VLLVVSAVHRRAVGRQRAPVAGRVERPSLAPARRGNGVRNVVGVRVRQDTAPCVRELVQLVIAVAGPVGVIQLAEAGIDKIVTVEAIGVAVVAVLEAVGVRAARRNPALVDNAPEALPSLIRTLYQFILLSFQIVYSFPTRRTVLVKISNGRYLGSLCGQSGGQMGSSGLGSGTANLDNRSMYLNFEVNCLIYSPRAVAELEEAFCRDLESAVCLDYQAYAARPFASRLVENACRLLSPIL